MKKSFQWSTFAETLETCLEAQLLKVKKSLNPLTNSMGFGIYLYKDITINLNRINNAIHEIAEDCMNLSGSYKREFPQFFSVSDGIHATMFSEIPEHIVEQIKSLVQELPNYQSLKSLMQRYGYKCELHYNQGRIFFGSLQIHFKKVPKKAALAI